MKSSTTFRRAMYSARLRCSVRNWEFEPEIRFSVLPSTQSETPVPPKIHFETNPKPNQLDRFRRRANRADRRGTSRSPAVQQSPHNRKIPPWAGRVAEELADYGARGVGHLHVVEHNASRPGSHYSERQEIAPIPGDWVVEKDGFEPEIRFSVLPSTQSETTENPLRA